MQATVNEESFGSNTTSNHESGPSGVTMAELNRALPSVHQTTGITDCIRKAERKYESTGSMDDLEEAIRVYEQGLKLSNDPYLQSVCLNNLGSALESLFNETDSIEYLDRAIVIKKRAVDSIPIGSPQRAAYIDGYGGLLQIRFERAGSIDDLNSAITAGEE